MAASTIYQNVADDVELEGLGQLFAGKKFWVAQRVPMRNRFLDDIKANGGQIVMLERKADYLIADHVKNKNCPPGSISYEFVEKSIQLGEIQDPEDHRCGPPLGEAREPGAINRPTKGSRAAYTAEEDRILYKWVRDAEAAGGLAGGNEIYKQLEAKYPRHTWQSWRDRYHKQLKHRPPSAFGIPDNAPPSPPPDHPSARNPSELSFPNQATQRATTEGSTQSAEATGPGKAKTESEYTLDELAGLFSSGDWEELYAYVDVIDDNLAQQTPKYDSSWTNWAESRGKQSADQWRQYYEKVVRPQWLQDPEWKRAKIKEKMEAKYNAMDASQSQDPPTDQEQPGDVSNTKEALTSIASEDQRPRNEKPSALEEERFDQLLISERNNGTAAYTFYAREMKQSTWSVQSDLDHVGLHKLLLSQWNLLSDASKAPYVALYQASNVRTEAETDTPSSEVNETASSTARHESPKFLADVYNNAMKRFHRDDNVDESDTQAGPARPTKRQKSRSATPVADGGFSQAEVIGTQEQPLEISSTESSKSASPSEIVEELLQQQISQEMSQALAGYDEMDGADLDDEDDVAESIESDDLPTVDRFMPPPTGQNNRPFDDLSSDISTPRAIRQKVSNFDTQAILSSPSQAVSGITKFPRSLGHMQDPETNREESSPARHPESDASTTQSLEEFRRSLNGEDAASQPLYPQLPPLSLTGSLSPAPSLSSNNSGDPDLPLEASELNEFFDEQHADGFNDEFIVKALKRTRMRPGLAIQVLEAWKEGKPLPNHRGIWSTEDDEAVESGDGLALAKLEKKHSMDGWGGITERLVFLESWRNR